ncbi:hypothetical protein [Qiania dongpingensis]|uniref:Uncharacterized protein n=1 Tax=Qiania dongpingensis TaxID=2763669 RepID=A0A7G9G717_9FIRM|nr:hypothetical protein [Qiania dongpingensis]QNM06599.1 hypothetical protein H9Q78_05555 [Qiania dongpingensis]
MEPKNNQDMLAREEKAAEDYGRKIIRRRKYIQIAVTSISVMALIISLISLVMQILKL